MKGLLFTYILVAVGVLGAFWTPAVGLFVYVAFAVLRPEFLWGFAGDLTRVSFIVGLATGVSWLCRFGSWSLGRGRWPIWMLVFYGAWVSVSTLTALNSSAATDQLLPLIKLILPLLIGATILQTEREAKILLWIIVITQGYIAFEMNDAYYLHGYNRAQDGFGYMDNNCFGISLVTVVGLAVTLGLSTKSWWARGVAFVAAALILHATLLTFSRGAFVGLVAVGVVAVVLMPKRPVYLLAVVLFALLTVRLMGPEVSARIDSTFATGGARDASAQSRLDLWADCLTVMAAHPILGIGPGNWKYVATQFGWTPGKQAHSTWMQAGAEVGVPGVLSLFLFYVLTGLKLWPILRDRSSPEAQRRSTMAVGIVLSMVGYVVSAMFVSLEGLEVPYYITLAGIVLLKSPEPDLATVTAPVPRGITAGPRQALSLAGSLVPARPPRTLPSR